MLEKMYNALLWRHSVKCEVVQKNAHIFPGTTEKKKKKDKILKELSCKTSKEHVREKWLYSMPKYIMKLR